VLVKILSIFVLLFLSPILVLIGIVIFLDDGFPILFSQKRVGRNNINFWIYKFRTMKKDTPDVASHLVNDNHSYHTRVGPFLRKFSLDELPQFINIFKGEMTLIGPRPALHNQDDLIDLRTKAGLHTLLPGLTGWAQVNGRDELSISDKVKMDSYFKDNQSIILKLKILYLTILKALKAENVSL